MKEWHREFESVAARVGMQLGRGEIGREGTFNVVPDLAIGWNWRIYLGFDIYWLFWYIGVYVMTPAYKDAILKRRQHYRDKPEDLKYRTALTD